MKKRQLAHLASKTLGKRAFMGVQRLFNHWRKVTEQCKHRFPVVLSLERLAARRRCERCNDMMMTPSGFYRREEAICQLCEAYRVLAEMILKTWMGER